MKTLLEDIYTNPDDDHPRLVYADWLQERGDPLGEFIVLQMMTRGVRKARRLRMRQLLKAYRHKWLAELADNVAPKATRFRRGFPATAVLQWKGDTAALDSKRWNTIEEVTFESRRKPLGPEFRALRVVRGLTAASVRMSMPLPAQLEGLCMDHGTLSRGVVDTLLNSALPKLARIDLSREPADIRLLSDLLVSKKLPALVRLSLAARHPRDIGELHRLAAVVRPRLSLRVTNKWRAVSLDSDTLEIGSYRVERDASFLNSILQASKRVRRLRVHVYDHQTEYRDALTRLLHYDVELITIQRSF